MKDDQISNLLRLRNLDQQKSTGPDRMHLRVMREVCYIIAGVLSINFEKSRTLWESLSDWRKADATAVFKKNTRKMILGIISHSAPL